MAKIIEKENIQDVYKEVVKLLKEQPLLDNGTREINNLTMVVHNPTTKNYWLPYRKISKKYADAELNWYWSGDNSCETIGKYASMWLNITDDGKTNNSAYGYILHKKYGFDQLQQIIELLKKDSSTRRAVLHIADPTINRITTKDMQCTLALQFLLRDGKLEETVYMRSNDIFFGLPYDYLYFISLGQYIAKQLNTTLSLYTHTNTSTHMYERDYDKFIEREKEVINIDIEEIIRRNYEK